jgi:hypothetical protein
MNNSRAFLICSGRRQTGVAADEVKIALGVSLDGGILALLGSYVPLGDGDRR